MAGFLYFIPGGGGGIKIDDIRSKGLGYAFDDTFAHCEVMKGPASDSGPGVCVAPTVFSETGGVVGYYKDKQIWTKIPGSDVWAGYIKDAPPIPADLAKREMVPGHWVELTDGNRWLCPVARQMDTLAGGTPTWSIALPGVVTANEKGEWETTDVVPKYQALWKVAQDWYDQIIVGIEQTKEQDKITFGFSDGYDAALIAISTNYRLGKAEASILHLFDTGTPTKILGALIDYPTLEDWMLNKEKKNTLETQDG